MGSSHKKDLLCYGVHALLPSHHEIRGIKRLHNPRFFGFRIWSSTWLLMDFFRRRGLPAGTGVMELGCGWGLAGIYCAKMHSAKVTCVDIDPEVFHFLHRQSEVNAVKMNTVNVGFDEVGAEHLRNVKVLIGADICFADVMVSPLERLILRAFDEGVRLVVLADPGRPAFNLLGERIAARMEAEILGWEVERPHSIQGRILRVGSPLQPGRVPQVDT